MKFSDIKFEPHTVFANGTQAKLFFPNGQGISIIRGEGSYGYESGLYEAAVLKGTESRWNIDYDSGITDDVVGYLSEDGVVDLIAKIEKL